MIIIVSGLSETWFRLLRGLKHQLCFLPFLLPLETMSDIIIRLSEL